MAVAVGLIPQPTSYLPGKAFHKSYTYTNFYNYLSTEDIGYKIYRQLHLSSKALI